MWDSIQGICSYLRGVLTTRSVLQGAGVGSATSSAVTAALIWVLKDGIGMIGSLGFAYLFSDIFETNIKEWRLFADLLNNVALTLDLALSLVPSYHLTFTALSAICKSCCWVCAGATKGMLLLLMLLLLLLLLLLFIINLLITPLSISTIQVVYLLILR